MKRFSLFLCVALLGLVGASKIKPRLVGGGPAIFANFAFVAAVYVTKPDGNYFCGGTLISDQHIMTSGYCVYNATSFKIQLGSPYLTREDPNRITLATSQWDVPPDFDPLTLVNDIGIITLRLPIQYSDYVKKLTYMPSYPNLPAGRFVMAAGWGQLNDEDAGLQEVLQQVNLTAISIEECRITYGNQLNDDMACAVGQYNEGTCIGDIGGPLVHYITYERYMSGGIASFISGNGCESTDPSGYTRTYVYMDWIKDVTGATFET